MKKPNFAIIAPTYRNENVYKNYIEKKDEKADTLDVGNNKLLEVSEVDGAAFVINKSIMLIEIKCLSII